MILSDGFRGEVGFNSATIARTGKHGRNCVVVKGTDRGKNIAVLKLRARGTKVRSMIDGEPV